MRLEWGEVCPRVLMSKLPGRSWGAIFNHGINLGLPRGLPQGYVSLREAAVRLGLGGHVCVRRLALRTGIVLRRHPHPPSLGPKYCPRMCVEWDAIREACERETAETETVHAAAEARGIPDPTLYRWLRDAGELTMQRTGAQGRGTMRVASAVVDRVIADRRPAGAVPVRVLAAQAGVAPWKISRWLTDSGLRRRRGSTTGVLPEVAARVLAARGLSLGTGAR